MLSFYIGIDPGATGAMAILVERGVEDVVLIYDYGDPRIVIQVKNLNPRYVHAVIEKVGAMPKQGVSSTFKFGVNYGWWQGVLDAYGIPYDFVTPAKWRKVMFDSMPKGDPKAMSLDRARRLFPKMADQLSRKKDHNRAEALLLSLYAKQTMGNVPK